MNSILIIGGGKFLGFWIAKELENLNYKVTFFNEVAKCFGSRIEYIQTNDFEKYPFHAAFFNENLRCLSPMQAIKNGLELTPLMETLQVIKSDLVLSPLWK